MKVNEETAHPLLIDLHRNLITIIHYNFRILRTSIKRKTIIFKRQGNVESTLTVPFSRGYYYRIVMTPLKFQRMKRKCFIDFNTLNLVVVSFYVTYLKTHELAVNINARIKLFLHFFRIMNVNKGYNFPIPYLISQSTKFTLHK